MTHDNVADLGHRYSIIRLFEEQRTICHRHYNDVIMSAMASRITSVSIVCSRVGSGGDSKKHKSSASLAFVRGIHRWPVKSPHKRPVTRKMFPFDNVIMIPHVGDKTHDNDILYILLWAFYMPAYCTMDLCVCIRPFCTTFLFTTGLFNYSFASLPY